MVGPEAVSKVEQITPCARSCRGKLRARMARAMADGRRGVRALCSERGPCPWRSVLTIRAARDCSERHDRRRVRWTASSWEQLQLGVLQPNARPPANRL